MFHPPMQPNTLKYVSMPGGKTRAIGDLYSSQNSLYSSRGSVKSNAVIQSTKPQASSSQGASRRQTSTTRSHVQELVGASSKDFAVSTDRAQVTPPTLPPSMNGVHQVDRVVATDHVPQKAAAPLMDFEIYSESQPPAESAVPQMAAQKIEDFGAEMAKDLLLSDTCTTVEPGSVAEIIRSALQEVVDETFTAADVESVDRDQMLGPVENAGTAPLGEVEVDRLASRGSSVISSECVSPVICAAPPTWKLAAEIQDSEGHSSIAESPVSPILQIRPSSYAKKSSISAISASAPAAGRHPPRVLPHTPTISPKSTVPEACSPGGRLSKEQLALPATKNEAASQIRSTPSLQKMSQTLMSLLVFFVLVSGAIMSWRVVTSKMLLDQNPTCVNDGSHSCESSPPSGQTSGWEWMAESL